MTLILVGPRVDYKIIYNEDGQSIEVYDYINKVAFKGIDMQIDESIDKPISIILRKYEIIPYIKQDKSPTIPSEVIKPGYVFIRGPVKKVENGCHNCANHNYDYYPNDGYGGEEFEICEKGNDLDGLCDDWEEL